MHHSIVILDSPDADKELTLWEQLQQLALEDIKFFRTKTIQEALALLIAIQTDLILIGPNLPPGHELKFVRQIKADARYAHLPLLLLVNADVPDKDLEQIWGLGVTDILFGPLHAKELKFRLKTALKSQNRNSRLNESARRDAQTIIPKINPQVEQVLLMAKVGMWEYDSATKSAYWSREIYNFLGYNPNEIRSDLKLLKKHLHPRELSQAEKALEQFLQTGSLNLTLRFIRTDHEVRFAHIQGFYYPQKEGHYKALGFFQDVTQTKRVESKLSELLEYSQRKSRETSALLHGTRSILEYTDLQTIANCLLDHCLPLVQGQAGAVYLFSPKNYQEPRCLAQRGEQELLNPAATHWQDMLEQALTRKTTQQATDSARQEIRYLCTPLLINEQIQGVLYLACQKETLAHHDLRMVSAFAELMDIALFNKRNLESLNKMAAALEQSGESICITDANRVIEYVNSTFEKTSGYTGTQVKGRSAAGFYPENQFNFKNRAAVINRGEQQSKTINGTQFTEEYTISPVLDLEGQTRNFVIISRDVTEKVLMEEKLQQAQKIEAIGTLAGGIAHDFNNLLMPIQGYLEMALLQLRADSQIYDYLSTALASSQRAKELVRQILVFSRKEKAEKQFLHLKSIVKETLKMMQATLPQNVELKTSIEPDLQSVYAGPGQIHQLLLNLCTNAGHAMRKTGGTLKVSIYSRQISSSAEQTTGNLLPGSYIGLTVSDTGQGIEAEEQKRIFEPFFSTKGPHEGTGMGLSVVHGIVQEIKGDISVQSTPGQGSSFQVLLPAWDTQTKSSPTVQEIPDSGKGHVLFVDDDPSITTWAKCSLARLGYTVTATTSPTEALHYFEGSPEEFDILVTDQIMPEMNGMQLIHKVRCLDQNTPIILCSGFNVAPLSTASQNIQGQLSKPFSMGEFSRLLKKCLKQSKVNIS